MTWGHPYRVTTDGRDVTLLWTGHDDDAYVFAVDTAGALLILPDDGPEFSAACVARQLHPARDGAGHLDLGPVREWSDAGVASGPERDLDPAEDEAGRDHVSAAFLRATRPLFAGLSPVVGQPWPNGSSSDVHGADVEVLRAGLAMWREALAGSAWVREATPVVRTPRLTLRPYSLVDEEAFVALFGDPRVTRWVGDGPELEEANRRLFGRVFTVVYAQHRFDVWGVWHQGQLIGHAEIKPTEVSGGHELIYVLAAEVWRRGLGTEHATVAAENVGSLALLDRLGYRRVRDIDQDTGGVPVVLTLDQRSWHAARSARPVLP